MEKDIVLSRKIDVEKYNDEPVLYCPRCYSLNIQYEDAIGSDCCGECGCSDIEQTSIFVWEKMYIKRYGHPFCTQKKNVRNTPIFRCSISDLKKMVFKSPLYKEIIHKIYPSFPKEFSKWDTVLLFFDRLVKDHKMDELRFLLSNLYT